MAYILDNLITFLKIYGVACFLGLTFVFVASYYILHDRVKKLPKFVNISLIILLLAIPSLLFIFSSIINPNYLGYGYSINGFEVVAHQDNVLWSQDYYVTSGGKFGSSAQYRIQALNLNNGQKLFNKLSSNKFKIQGSSNHNVWMNTDKEIIGLDIQTGKVTTTINEQNLIQAIPELSSGIYEINFNKKTSFIDIKSKDGLDLTVNPATLKKVIIQEKQEADAAILKIDDQCIHYPSGERILTLDRQGERQTLEDGNKKKLNQDLFFLGGKFLQIDTVAKIAIILSNETLEKTNYLIRCVSLQGKLIWEGKQDILKIKDFYNPNPSYKMSFIYNNDLILAFDGFIISLKLSNGEVNWRARL
jgi:hypothetical protein